MPGELSISLASGDRVLAAALLAFVVIVVASGALALLMIARSRLRRDLRKRERKNRDIPDAWEESGRRLEIPPGPPPPRREEGDGPDHGPDGGPDDSDDDDDGDIPRPVVPSSPAISAGS